MKVLTSEEFVSKAKEADKIVICRRKCSTVLSNLNIVFEKLCVWTKDFGIKKMDEVEGIISYSQDGEDSYLKEKFAFKKCGTYVDVGAYHPYRYSNTVWAYRRGWGGMNIGPNPEMIEIFELFLP